MNKFRFALQIFSLFGLFLVFAHVAEAQTSRTWVSGLGSDANTCSRTAPCATFAGALSRTNIGGEINCLDPGGYGSPTINKSVTIDCEDTQGAILATSGAGITINLNDSNDPAKNVRLRGLIIQGVSNAQHGIRMQSLGKLTVEEVAIDGFLYNGISIENPSSVANLVVKNTSIRNNFNRGISVSPLNAAATVFVIDSLITGNGVGFYQGGTTTGIIQNSTFTGNYTGIQASQPAAVLAVKGCQITHNNTGVHGVTSATILIGTNIITGNGTGLLGTESPIIKTWGENFVDGNTLNGTNDGTASSQ